MAFTPSSVATNGHVVTQITSTDSLPWTTSIVINTIAEGGGGLFTNAGATTPYTPGTNALSVYLKMPNVSRAFTVNQTGGGSVAITGTGILHGGGNPTPSYAFGLAPQFRETMLQTKRDGSVNGRVLGDMVVRRDYDLNYLNVLVSEYLIWEAFWNNHAPGRNRKFSYTDSALNLSGNYQFVAPPSVNALAQNRISFTVSIIQVP